MKTFAFIDASNLFYGGEKSLGWKIDYKKFADYLKIKYGVSRIYYFGGVELHGYVYDYLKNDSVSIEKVEKYLESLIKKEGKKYDEAKLMLLSNHLQRVKFYLKLKSFGYDLYLKPVKLYHGENDTTQRKANCDVEMAFYIMRDLNKFDKLVFLSGDGDFLPVLKYLRKVKKSVIVLARGERTAKEIRQFAGSQFRDFNYLRELLKYEDKK